MKPIDRSIKAQMEINVLQWELDRLKENWTVENYFQRKRRIEVFQERIQELQKEVLV